MGRDVLSSCRACNGQCAMRFTLDDAGRIVRAVGERANPVTRGYACIKGLNLHEAHYSPNRLLRPLKRNADGDFAPIALDRALDEIAAKLEILMARHGADTIGTYKGTLTYAYYATAMILPAWSQAIGSRSYYSTVTIDQSAKWVTAERLGSWDAGHDPYGLADVLMCVGSNPLVSLATFNFTLQDPARALRALRARGTKVIVIDPRETETARHADIFLQPVPGEDVAIMAGLIRIVLERGWHDADFCASHADGLDALRRAVDPWTPECVARRAGIPADRLIAAARMFAEPIAGADGPRRPRGSAASGTGPNMAPHSNLSEHLLECLNVICGRFARAGDPVPNPGVLMARRIRRAQVNAPIRGFETGWTSPITGLGLLCGEKMTGALPDEILSDHPGRLTALIVDGGNPVNAMAGQAEVGRALSGLELLVAIDPFMTSTARLADYVLPPRMMLERPDIGPMYGYEEGLMFTPYAHYAQPVIDVPPDSELIDDWAVFWELATRLDRQIVVGDIALPTDRRPDGDEILDLLLRDSAVPLAEIRGHPGGRLFDVAPMTVEPAEPHHDGRFALAPADVLAEIDAAFHENTDLPAGYTHRLCVRRLREVVNSVYRDVPAIAARLPENPAYLHPADLAGLGLASGDRVTLHSPHGSLPALVRADATMKPGVLSMPHGWGGLPGAAPDPASPGSNTNLLTHAYAGRQTINAMPVMTGIPLRIEPAAV